MKDIRLNIEKQWYGVMNTLTDKRKRRNALIDAKREHKKDKDKVTAIKRELKKIDDDILVFETSRANLEKDFDSLNYKLGNLRLKNCVLSEALYDNIIAYEEFIKNNCYIEDDGVINDIKQAINLLKKLPFECGDSENDRFREVYSAIADAYIEKQSTILDGIFQQIMIELNNENTNKIK